jgi:predicted DNA-binding transcriptional regulator AlpA
MPPTDPANDNRPSALPASLAPRGLSRVVAAEYIGVSPSLFDKLVTDGRMPKPKAINSRRVWDRLQIDEYFTKLSGNSDAEDNPWDAAA